MSPITYNAFNICEYIVLYDLSKFCCYFIMNEKLITGFRMSKIQKEIVLNGYKKMAHEQKMFEHI